MEILGKVRSGNQHTVTASFNKNLYIIEQCLHRITYKSKVIACHYKI